MDLDDKQQFTHGVRLLVESTNIVRAEISKLPFTDNQIDEMVLTYWRAIISHSFAPDISGVIRSFLPGEDNDDEE